MSEEREPVPIADVLAEVRAELGLGDTSALTTLVDRWDEVVGSDVAAHARLEGIRDGAVSIAVDSPIWASQLRYLETAILERANALVGAPVAHSVKVRVRAP